MKIVQVSPLTGKGNTMDIDVTMDQFVIWHRGTPIQEAMPHLSPDEREFLMTGYTPEDWVAMFGTDED